MAGSLDIAVLLVAGGEVWAGQVETALADRPGFALCRVRNGRQALAALAQAPPALILVALESATGGEEGLDLYHQVAARAGEAAVVALVEDGARGEELGRECLRSGAQDFLTMGELGQGRLAAAMAKALERQRLVASMMRRNEALISDLLVQRDINEQNADGIMVVDDQGVLLYLNRTAQELLGRPPEELLGEVLGFPLAAGESTELDLVRQDANLVLEMRVAETSWEGEPALLASLRDITHRRRAEAERMRLATAARPGGQMAAQSGAKQGCRCQADTPAGRDESPEHPEPAESEPGGVERILFVDDEMGLVDLAERALGRLGYQVEGFTDPLRAWSRLESNAADYDLLITDLTMPGLSGLELIQRLEEAAPQLPVIILTGYEELIRESGESPPAVRAVLNKPVGTAQLARAVRQALDSCASHASPGK